MGQQDNWDGTFYEQGSTARQAQRALKLPEEAAVPRRQTVVVREKLEISPFAVLGVLVIAALFALMIGSYMRLYSLTSSNAVLEDQLTELEETNAELQSTYESSYDLEKTETYAQERLGMEQPSSEQVIYLNLSGMDEAVVLNENENVFTQIWQSLKESVDYMMEFIGNKTT